MLIPKASEFFIAGIDGAKLTASEKTFFANNFLGGVILFKRNIESLEQVIELNCSLLLANRESPPIISVDQEGGRVARLTGICTDVPPLASLASVFTRDPHQVYRLAAMQARELVSLGFQQNFAPVCDVMNNSNNEVIGDRSFSSDASIVAELAKFYIRGLQGAGIAGCAKHFPGHGRTAIDSHLALPIIDTDFNTLEHCELKPFKAAISVDVATIMTAHIVTKPLDMWPATMSEITLTQLLRNQCGFNNVIISDDLTMKAVADNYTLKEIIERSMLAGVDMFIIGNDFACAQEAMALLDQLIASDKTIEKKALAAKKRILHLRRRYVGKPALPDLALAKSIVRSRPHLELIETCR